MPPRKTTHSEAQRPRRVKRSEDAPKVEVKSRIEAEVMLRDDADGQYDQGFKILPGTETVNLDPALANRRARKPDYAILDGCFGRVRISHAEAEAIAGAVRFVISETS